MVLELYLKIKKKVAKIILPSNALISKCFVLPRSKFDSTFLKPTFVLHRSVEPMYFHMLEI